LLQLET